MGKVKELFGIYCNDSADLAKVVSQQICPYSGKKCYKTRKSDPGTAIGTCTVQYQDNSIIICPNRLLENNQVFIDCLHLLSLHEPGNELYVIPEVSIPGGNVDYFLVSAKDGKVKDFTGIEFQTMDTTGTVWPERQRLLNEHGFVVDRADIENKKPFGMNWKMTAKTILIQMHHKSETFEYLNKHLVLIIQKPFFDYINREFSFSHIQGARIGDPVHIHAYDFKETGNRLKLSLSTRISTDSNGIAKSLGLNAQPKVELEELIATLEQKLSDEYRLSIL
jgi:hypothetical protein